MSADTIRGLDVRDWEGSTFDPSNKRLFSMLPDCDADEAYCVRHEREMPPARIVHKWDGALYMAADDWDIYSCPDCYREVGPKAELLFKRYLLWAFKTYDDPDVDGLDGAFKYIGEAGDVGVEPGVNADD